MNSTAKKYQKINILLEKISSNNENFNNKDMNIYVKNRILQIISTNIVKNFKYNLSFENFKVSKKYKINLKKKFIAKLFFINLVKSLILSFYCFFTLLKKKRNEKLNLIEVDFIKNKVIYDYCVGFIKENKNIFNQRKYYITGALNNHSTNKESNYYIIRENIAFFLINNYLNFNERIKLIYLLTKNIFINIKLFNVNKLHVLILEDYLFLSIIKFVNLENYITTSNRVQNTPLWLNYRINKKFKSKMFWLGETALSLPRVFKKEKNLIRENFIPFYKFINIDEHIVWNKSFKIFLNKIFLINQSILNYRKPLILTPLKKYKKKQKNLFIFDNNPKELGFNGVAENYVSFQNIKKYLDDICEEFNDISKKNSYIFIKRKKYLLKKDQSPLQKQYLHNFDELIKKHKNIKLIDERDEYLKYLNSSKLCINFPFSSSASVSEYYKIQTLFYDPTGNLSNNYYKKKIPLISTRRNLNTILLGLFNKN